MGFREIVMIIISLILGVILVVNTAPSLLVAGEAVKVQKINEEIHNIESSSKIWMINNSINGDFTNLNAETLSTIQKKMPLSGTGNSSYFNSLTDSIVTYTIISRGQGYFDIQISNLNPSRQTQLLIILSKEYINVFSPDAGKINFQVQI